METVAHLSQQECDKEDAGKPDLPGFRFHPTEQELVGFYLKNMVQGKHFNTDVIGTLDLYRYDPWQLPSLARVRGEREWFFFVRRDCRINGSRPSRIAVSGYWKATGSDREVRNEKLKCIGFKKTLVFYIGRAPRGHRTDWLMNEYRMPPHSSISNLQIDAVVVCRIYRKAMSLKSLDQRAARSKCDRYKPRGTISPCDDVKTAILTGQSSDSSYSAEENCIDGEPRINSVEDDRKNVTHSGLSSQGCHIVDDIDHFGMTTVELPFMEDDIHKVTPQGFPVWGSLSALMDSNSLRCCTSPDKESQVLVPKVSTDFCNEPSLAFLNYLDSNSWEELWASPSNTVCSAPSPLNLCCHNSSFDSSIDRQ